MAKPVHHVSMRVHYMLAITQALASNGGSARPSTVYTWIEAQGQKRYRPPPPNVDAEMHYQREVRFARQELADGGVVFSDNGIWKLVHFQADTQMTAEWARVIIRENRRRREERASKSRTRKTNNGEDIFPTNIKTIYPTTGPRPSLWEGTIVRQNGPASTYIFKFGNSNLWKIGFAADVDDRLKQVNQHVPIELLKSYWKIEKYVKWPSQDLAYAMEQAILQHLKDYRTFFERVRCSIEKLASAWDAAYNIVLEKEVSFSEFEC